MFKRELPPPDMDLAAVASDEPGLDAETLGAKLNVIQNHSRTTMCLLWTLADTFFTGVRRARLKLALKFLAEFYRVWPLTALTSADLDKLRDMFPAGATLDEAHARAIIQSVSRGFLVAYGPGKTPSSTVVLCWITHAIYTACTPGWELKDPYEIGTPPPELPPMPQNVIETLEQAVLAIHKMVAHAGSDIDIDEPSDEFSGKVELFIKLTG